MRRKLIHSQTKKDFKVDTFTAGGPGGQHRNRKKTAVRITHRQSGISSSCSTYKSQNQNRKEAFRKLANSEEYKAWSRLEVSRIMGKEILAQKKVKAQMRPTNLKIEHKIDGRWVEV